MTSASATHNTTSHSGDASSISSAPLNIAMPAASGDVSLEENGSPHQAGCGVPARLKQSGTGFFITETGVIATNAHIARDEEKLLAALPGGPQLEAKVVYIDAEPDVPTQMR